MRETPVMPYDKFPSFYEYELIYEVLHGEYESIKLLNKHNILRLDGGKSDKDKYEFDMQAVDEIFFFFFFTFDR